MTSTLKTLMLGAATLALTAGATLAENVIIGHFGSPTPMQVARAEGKFDAAPGWTLWRCPGGRAWLFSAVDRHQPGP
jgi:taurine transport system substrate-binding protein